ncbi:MAG: site-specific DNA-methyltransferase [Gammaproteobacteria bacterium]|nr:MAG: site-specific DNA-methyltransferase [Gammaproteobacteria bacterium]
MTKEERFFNALRDVFVGAKVEGESGFVNLMRIKSCYYEKGVFPRLNADIERALEPFPEFREELFDRLYTFFRRYFSESGSIYFRFTPPHEHVYEKVYTDDRDVALFWKTHMLYYVKTDRLFRSMAVEVDDFLFFFDVSTLEHKRANEKRALVFTFKKRREDGTLVFSVAYSENNRKTKIDDIRRAIKDALGLRRYTAQVPSEETLERAFRLFERQSEVDFFINKNARRFLQEQFNLWLYQYVFEPAQRQGTVWTEKRIRQLQVLKEIAYKIIDFIAQFEDELVRIWNKPKFVLGSHYVITLDRIAAQEGGMEVLERLFAHAGMEAQVQEWRDLGMVEEDFTPEQVWVTDLMGKRLHERYQYLPIDTKHFPDLETAILALFDHLDQALDGWLVNSENYQALNTMLPKFRERIQTIYIDPPFNLGNGGDFDYLVNYKDANWASLLEPRLRLAKHSLALTGSIFVRSDYNGDWIVRCLMDEIFGKENFRNEIHVRRTRTLKGENKKFHTANDTLLFYAKEMSQMHFHGFKKEKAKPRWVRMHLPGNVKGDASRVVFGKKIYPPPGRKWVLDQKGFDEAVKAGLVKWDEASQEPLFLSKYTTVGSDWTDISSYSSNWGFKTENSEDLLFRVLKSTSKEKEIVLDFFLGSGTTSAVAQKLGRKWIGIEMGAQFDEVTLPRMKKVLSGEELGISKSVNWQGGGFFKYFRLEQYEEVLRKAHYRDEDEPLFLQDPYTQYVFLRDPKMLDNAETGEPVMEMDTEQNEIRVDLSKLYPDIDRAETLSCLTGKWIRRIHPAENDPTQPGTVEFEDGTTVDLQSLPWEMSKPLIWW